MAFGADRRSGATLAVPKGEASVADPDRFGPDPDPDPTSENRPDPDSDPDPDSSK